MLKNSLAILIIATLNNSTAHATDVNIRNFCKVAADTNTIEGMATNYGSEKATDYKRALAKNILNEDSSDINCSNNFLLYYQANHGVEEAVIDWYWLKHSESRVRLAAWNEKIRGVSTPKLWIKHHTFKPEELNFRASSLGRPEGFDESTENLLANPEIICKGFGVDILDLRECSEALTQTVLENDTIITESGLVLSNIEAWKRVLIDPRQYIASYILAEQIYRKVNFAKKYNFVYGNFYNDIIDAYQRVYQNKKIAEEKAWDFITLYATRGPVHNIWNLTQFSVGSHSFHEYFRIIFVGLHVLDSFSIQHGFLYSLPESVNKTDCIISKPYHFWYSALVTRTLLKHGYSENIAKTVPYILGTLYNFGTTAFTDRNSFYSRSVFAPENNVVRLSMASRRLGIDYIIEHNTISKSTRPLDTILKKMIKTADTQFKQRNAPDFLIKFTPKELQIKLNDYYKFEALFSIDALNPYKGNVKY